ncbi:DUF1330 domain-containing protein [Novosphingobium lentum]|uniref:DUF1330 domain-containing protein n=1 Tax=Novosphingobium lentum TaxID=145287 RepID=UPI000AAF6846|nr:DUF1330 domain-containing protein [Novosphingobium lentum]
MEPDVLNYIDPSRETFSVFKALPRDTPIRMLNLIKFREVAAYPKGHDCAISGWSGREAYAAYHDAIAPILARVGAEMAWSGAFECVVTGPADWPWDATFVMGYPDAAAFLAMVTDAEYKRAVVHRQAAVEDSRLVRFGVQVG